MARDLSVNILAPSQAFEAGVKRMEASARALHASELRLIAAEERLEKLRTTGKATAGQLATAQASVISAQDNVAKAHLRTASSAEAGQKRTSSAFDKIGRSAMAMRTGVGLAAAAGGAAMAAMAKQTVDAATDLQEQMSATKTLFKEAADEVIAFGESAEAIGISTRAALEASNTFGDLFTKLGYTHEAAAVFSEDLVRIAADFASFKNMSPEETLDKLRSGLAGESEPLRALGVFLTEAKVKAEAMRLGLVDAHGELDDGAKVAARYSLIIGGMGEAYGDAERTADSYANTQRRFSATMENLKATLGEGLLPVLTDVTTIATKFADQLSAAEESAGRGGGWTSSIEGWLDHLDVWEKIPGALDKLAGSSDAAAESSDYAADSVAGLADAESRVRVEAELSAAEIQKQQEVLEKATPAVALYASQLGLSAETTKALVGEIEAYGEQLASFIDPLGAYTGKLDEKEAAEREAAQTTADTTEDTSDSWEDFFQEQSVSFDEYIAELQEQVTAQQEWSTNMLLLAGRVSAGTLEELARMGPEGAPLIADMVTRSDEELAKLEPLLVARTKSATEAQAVEWRQWGELAPKLTATIGKNAVDALTAELAAGTTTVAAIAQEYSAVLYGGLAPLLTSLGKPMVMSLIRQENAQAQRTVKRAAGGPVWGEGTATSDSIPALLSNGEYVIRADSVSRYGHDFLDAVNQGRYALGGLVRRFAKGGFATTSDVPRPPSTSPFGPPISTAADATMQHAYQAAMEAVRTLAPQLMAAVGGGSAKGLNPQFLAMFNAYNAALGNILKIGSGWRSSAQQAVLYQRWINRVPGQAPAAPPGRSNHERGLAIDHTPHSTPRMRAVAGAHGLRYPMSYEPWHVEPANIRNITHRSGGPVRRMAFGGSVGGRQTSQRGPADIVRAGQVSDAMWDRLLGAGWQGNSKDAMEALYKPLGAVVKLGQVSDEYWRRLLADGWKGSGTDGMEALYRPLSAQAALAGAPNAFGAGFDLSAVAATLGSVEEVRALVEAWEAYNEQLEQAARRQRLVDVRSQAHANTLVTASTEDMARAQEAYVDATKALQEFDLAAAREAELAAVEKLIDGLEAEAEAREKVAEAARVAAEWATELAETTKQAQDDALRDVNRLLDQEQDLRARDRELVERHAREVAEVQGRQVQAEADYYLRRAALGRDFNAEQQRILDARRDALAGWAPLDQVATPAWGNTVEQLVGNARDQLMQFEEWMQELSNARARGVSEAVIASLGLDEGPQALGQLRQFGRATAAEIDSLNATVAQRTTMAGQQTAREQQNLYGDLGQALVESRARYVEDLGALDEAYRLTQDELVDQIEMLNDDLLLEQAQVAQDLAVIGQDQGRSYGEALAAGLDSQLPAVQAAAAALQAAAASATAAAAQAKDYASRPGAPGQAAPGAPPLGTAGSFTLNGRQVHVNQAGIIDTPGDYYGMYPAQVMAAGSRTGSRVFGAPRRQTYDAGGWLEPGFTLAYNGTGQRERVVTAQQAAQPAQVTVNARVFVGDREITDIVRVEVGAVQSSQRTDMQVAGRRG